MSHWGKNIASNIVEVETNKNNYECISRFKINNYNGPMNEDILSIIYGTLLGDGYAEKRKGGKGTRICFYQEGSHKDYLLYLHRLVSNLGYCNTNKPVIQKRLGRNGKVREILRFTTWTYTKLNSIYLEWYDLDNKKRVPISIYKYLTPLALAIWIMDDGGKVGSGLKLSTNGLKLDDVKYLQKVLENKYELKSSIQKTGAVNQYCLYIWKESIPKLQKIVKPYIIKSMQYKLIYNE